MEHQKYIYQKCEYCPDWKRPADATGNADYIKHVIENHLAEAVADGSVTVPNKGLRDR